MSKKYTEIDSNGFPIAFYVDDINEIPEGAFEITDDQWHECLENQGLRKFINGELIIYVPSPLTEKEVAIKEIIALEATITPRRVREAILNIDNGWLYNLETEIYLLREKL
jgi:hypothetical protein